MITRIVKMTFKTENINTFLNIFNASRNKISSFKGCTYLELVRDEGNKSIFFTISKWRDETSLEEYRNSEVFKETWAKTKVLFNNKPIAWSTVSIFNSLSD